jgi:hypothetical protein
MISRSILLSLQANVRIVPELGHYSFLPNIFQFILYLPTIRR